MNEAKHTDRLTACDDEVSVSTNPNGSITVAAIIDGHRVARTYYFATREEAVSDFLDEVNA